MSNRDYKQSSALRPGGLTVQKTRRTVDSVSPAGSQAAAKPSGLRHSLTWHLARSYLLATSLTLMALCVAIYLITAVYLNGRLKEELGAQAGFYATYAARVAPDEGALTALAPTIVGFFAPQADLTVRLFAASDGALLSATQDIGPQPSGVTLAELRYRSPSVFTQPSRELPHRRYAALPVVSTKRTIGVVEVSRSTLASDRFLASLREILLVTILVAAAVTLVISVCLARRLSRPIREMERATRRISAGDLDIRLPEYAPDEIGRLSRSIVQMGERLRYLESSRVRFISEISHDLRTPLTAVKGLLVNLIDASEPAKRRSLEIAEREADRLIRLVNQLLDFSRWEVGRLELDCCSLDLGALAQDALILCEERALHRGVALHIAVSDSVPPVTADADRLQRIILNLLDNALKFTLAGGAVTLAVTQRDRAIEVSVRDTGRGMSDEEQRRAFEPYFRGEGGGAGLGLAIARGIVEAHGGEMGLESGPGQGTRAWFTIPL